MRRGIPIAPLASSIMDGFTMAAASGMRARMESLDLLANNLANQASPGYKADREFYSLYVAPEAVATDAVSLPTTAPVIERRWTDFSQGILAETGNPFHLALSGPGFFRIQGPDSPLYTRNGSFRVSPAGRLETQEGYAVVSRTGQPITIYPARPVEITATGEIRQDGQAVAQLDVVTFPQPQSLDKQAGTYFRLADPTTGASPAAATVYQGRLEGANHSPAESAVRLITVLRQFEMLQKAVQIGGEMSRRVDDIARVSGS